MRNRALWITAAAIAAASSLVACSDYFAEPANSAATPARAISAPPAAGPIAADPVPSHQTIAIDAAKEGVRISPQLYGVFLEEIGHGVDGGLYGEKLQNRAFEDAKAPEGFHYQTAADVAAAAAASGRGRGRGGGGGAADTGAPRGPVPSGFRGTDAQGGRWVDPGLYATTFVWEADKSLPYWQIVKQGGAAGTMSLDMTNPLNANSPRSCKLEITSVPTGGRVGIANEGWCAADGQAAVGIKEGEKYELTFYARCAPGFDGAVSASLENTGGYESNVATVSGITAEWKQFKAELTATKTDPASWFLLTAKNTGTLWFDMVSLFPAKTFKNRPNGLRTDIAQMIADMKPGFVRFPGGCVVEAATVETAYNWKNTLGAVEQRPECWNAWDYRRTHGMGMFEYLQFIEDIGATPMYVGFAGQTCIYRSPEEVPMDQMGPIVDGFVDLVEYANGPVTSKWGKMRAEAGHPAPFGLHIMEIGNENNDPGGGRGQPPRPVYTPRYGMIYDALKKAHPEIQTIADDPVRGHTVEMIDEHHYESPAAFINANFDRRDRRVPLYLGEVAVTSPPLNQRGNLQCALAEGTYLMNCERNADLVKMVSYAPLLGHVNGLTELAGAPPPWHAMIYFDSNQAYGTASYYLWKTFGVNRPSVNLQTSIIGGVSQSPLAGNVGIGTWGNAHAEFKDFKVENSGKVLYTSDFAKGAAEWNAVSGNWGVTDGVAHQTGNQNAFAYVGDENWTDYTISLKARKTGGDEGFLIIFGHKGNDRSWWNIGGWGNTRHGIEMNQIAVGESVEGKVETNRWYDIKLEVAGRHVRAYLDGKLMHDVQVPMPVGPVSAIAGRDDATGDIVVKVINRGADAQTMAVDVRNIRGVQSQATATVMASARLQDNNSLDTPQQVVPVEKSVTISGPRFDFAFPAYSLTVLRVKPLK